MFLSAASKNPDDIANTDGKKHLPPMFTSHWNFEHLLDDFFGENNNITLRLNMPFQYQTYSLTEKSLSDFTSQQD